MPSGTTASGADGDRFAAQTAKGFVLVPPLAHQ
jgi:hypothetical protein